MLFSFLLLKNFYKKFCRMILTMILWVWFKLQIMLPAWLFTSLISSCFLTYSLVFQKQRYLLAWKILFQNHVFHFFLSSISILINDLMFVLDFLYVWHIFYRWSWEQVFQLFQFLFFQEKTVNHCESHVIFQDIQHQLQERSFISIFIVLFCKILQNWDVFWTHLKPPAGNFCYNAHPYKLFMPQ